MAVISSRGRYLSDLPIASTLEDSDLFFIQKNGTKYSNALRMSQLRSNLLSTVSEKSVFTNTQNQFTGSFYSPSSGIGNFFDVNVRDNLTVANTSNFTGGNFCVNIGVTNTFIRSTNICVGDTNTDAITIGSCTTSCYVRVCAPKLTAKQVIATGITSSAFIGPITGSVKGLVTGYLVGNVTGSVVGDIYSSTGTKVLENGAGGVSTSYFYGTSSFAISSSHALTASYSANAMSSDDGLPAGGTTNQVLTKNSDTSYDVSWTTSTTGISVATANSLVSASMGGTDTYIPVFTSNGYKIENSRIRQFSGYTNFATTDVYVQNSLNVINNITGSNIIGTYLHNVNNLSMSLESNAAFLEGDRYGYHHLYLDAIGTNATMSLKPGQESIVLIENTGSNGSILEWSGSTDQVDANTTIYWEGGISPTITTAVGSVHGFDILKFRNINNRIFGSYTQNYGEV